MHCSPPEPFILISDAFGKDGSPAISLCSDDGWYKNGPVRAGQPLLSGCSSAWPEHCVRDAGVAGSNPVTPTIFQQDAELNEYRHLRMRPHTALNPQLVCGGL